MPFTPAHSAIVLPFIRSKRLSATGLVIGSMAPDFEYFFKMSVNSEHSHTIAGLFYFDLPVTVLLALIFHQVVKRSFIDNLPAFFQARFQPLREFNFIQFLKLSPLLFLLSALLGAASHIFWDGFTHSSGFFVNQLSFLYKGAYVPFDGVKYPLWYGLQHICTFVGIACIAVYIFLMEPAETDIRKPAIQYWIFVAIISSVIVLIRFGFTLDHVRIGNMVVSSIASFCVAVILLGLYYSKGSLGRSESA